MGLFNRSRTSVASDEPAAGRGYGRNAVRGIFTLAGIIAAGVLVWLAHYPNLQHAGGFWGAMGLLAGAGLVLGLSQLFGGWTKWGMPKISLGVLLLGWLPGAIATGWILLTAQPSGGWQHARLTSWSDSIGVLGFVRDIGLFPAAIALAFGVVTAFVFDTTGPRVPRVVDEPAVVEEDVHDYRDERVGTTTTTDEAPVDRTTTATRRVEIHDPAER